MLVPPPRGAVVPLDRAPTFSVVVAAYQAETTVAEAVDSALAQTLPPLEVVVCDDGSTDGTAAVLARYDAPVRVVRRENGGEAAAKNTAVAAARGDYVVVLDADDVFDPRRLEALAWLARQRPDLDVLTTDAFVEVGGTLARQAYHPGWTFPVADQRREILTRNFVLGLAAVRRERWLEAGGFDESIARATDWDFWLRLVLAGSQVGLVDVPLARYRLAPGSLSSDRRRLVAARIEVLSRAAARSDLTAEDRATVAASLRRERADLRRRDADATLRPVARGARAAHLRLALAPGLGPRARVRAAVGVLAPRVLARRQTAGVEVGSGLRLPPG